MSNLQGYNEYQEYEKRHAAGYAAVKAAYETMQPPPAKPRRYALNLETVGVAVVMAASIIVSASRTVHEFGVVGAPAVLMLEMGAVMFAYFRISHAISKDRAGSVSAWINRGLSISVLVLLAGNLDAVLSSQFQMPGFIDVAIQLAIAVSAPLMTLITGEVLGMLIVRQRAAWREVNDQYEAAMADWRDGLNKTWNAQKSRMGVRVEMSAPIPMESNGNSIGSGAEKLLPSKSSAGHTKAPDASKRVQAYFVENPTALTDFSLQDVMAATGAQKSTIYAVRKSMQSIDVE